MPINAFVADVTRTTTLTATAKSLSDMGFPDATLDNAVYAILQTSGGAAYFRVDGGTPTQTAGLGLGANKVRKITGNSNVRNLRFILKAGESATKLRVTLFATRKTEVSTEYYPGVVASMGYDVYDWSTLNAGTLFQDSAKTTPVASNSDPVGAWVDGVQGVTASQVTTANKPTYTTASLGGLPTLAFDGGDLLATANIEIGTFAVWVVFRNSVTAINVICEQSVSASGNSGFTLVTSAPPTIRVRRSALASEKTLSVNWGNDNTWRIVRHTYQGTHATNLLSINNVLQSLANGTSTGDPGDSTVVDPLFIGARSGVVGGMTGNIAHLCIVSPYPTDAIIASMESYINGIWSVY